MVSENKNDFDENIIITNDDRSECDEHDPEKDEENATAKFKKIREKLKLCEKEKMKILEDSQRARADFLNARRRIEEDRCRDQLRHKKKFIEDILPLCDSFEMAKGDKDAWDKIDKTWRAGIEGIYTQLSRLLESYDVRAIDPIGQEFDPQHHDAIGTAEVDDKEKCNKIVQVAQKGYEISFDGKTDLIRPARVTIGIVK